MGHFSLEIINLKSRSAYDGASDTVTRCDYSVGVTATQISGVRRQLRVVGEVMAQKSCMVVYMPNQLDPLNLFVAEMTNLLSVARNEELIIAEGKLLLGALRLGDDDKGCEVARPH